MTTLTKEMILLPSFLATKWNPSCGGIATFTGIVRDHHQGKGVLYLDYECYEVMAEKEIERIIAEAKIKFPVHSVRILHRTGRIEIGEIAVAIEVIAEHRDEAFKACRFSIDEIKRRVPIWKHEFYTDGSNEWVRCDHIHEGAQ